METKQPAVELPEIPDSQRAQFRKSLLQRAINQGILDLIRENPFEIVKRAEKLLLQYKVELTAQERHAMADFAIGKQD